MAEEQTKKQEEEKQEKNSVETPESSPAKSDDNEKDEIEIPKKLEGIVKKIEEMKLIDLADLVKILEKKFGVSSMPLAAAPIAAPQAAGAETGQEAGGKVNVVLTATGDKKIEVIKAVKEITQKGLKDCKDLVDAVDSEPQTVKEDVKREEATKMAKRLETAGAKVELK